MLELLQDILNYPFLFRALLAGLLISICSALLGVNLVLKRYAMIGDGLSHVSFGALALGMALGFSPYLLAVPVVLLAGFFLLKLSDKSGMRGDAALAMISSSSLALGIIAVSWGQGVSTDVYNYMFGSILTTSKLDLSLIAILTAVLLLTFVLFYHKFFAISFDENFAAASGLKVGWYNMLLAALTSLTVVMGIRIMGALLISALIIFPALSAMRLFKSYKAVTWASLLFSLLAFLLGFIASYHFSTPSGASIVLANLGIFLIAVLIAKLKPFWKQAPPAP